MINQSTYDDVVQKFKEDFVYSLHILSGFLDIMEIRSIFEHALAKELTSK